MSMKPNGAGENQHVSMEEINLLMKQCVGLGVEMLYMGQISLRHTKWQELQCVDNGNDSHHITHIGSIDDAVHVTPLLETMCNGCKKRE